LDYDIGAQAINYGRLGEPGINAGPMRPPAEKGA
jgi:hypothetical protein